MIRMHERVKPGRQQHGCSPVLQCILICIEISPRKTIKPRVFSSGLIHNRVYMVRLHKRVKPGRQYGYSSVLQHRLWNKYQLLRFM